MTLAELALTIALLGALGLVARRIGLSAIPAYLLAGILLGPNEPREFSFIQPSEVTEFVAELGLVFLLFFLGLEFSIGRLTRTGRHVGLGGTADLVVNLALGIIVGLVAFGPTTAGRMDSYVDLLQSNGASMVMIAKGNRSQQVTDACKKHGGFYLGSIGGPAAVLAEENIKKVECIDFPELGMEAVWKIEVENFPAFILVDDKGNDFFKKLGC